MTRTLAINVGANTSLPGFRGPIYPDGRFEYVPIPERKPTVGGVPTYADLPSAPVVPEAYHDRRVHLDPEFRGFHESTEFTYGDEHGVKAGPISQLSSGDRLLFYATLEPAGDGHGDYPGWIAPNWGAYLIGAFVLGWDPVDGDEYRSLPATRRRRFATNAHVKRATFDAKVLVYGDPEESRLLDRAIPLSSPDAGADPNWIVTDLSDDSGDGPWWRRPLRFDADATGRLIEILETPSRVAPVD